MAAIRLFRPTGTERKAVVSTEPSVTPGAFMIRVAIGTGGTVYGPYPEAEVEARVAEAVKLLVDQGFAPSGQGELLERLASKRRTTRALAAVRLGWRKSHVAVAPLLALLEDAKGEACVVIDALGAIGDARAIAAIRPFAERKLLSRRRSAVEALRNLGDAEGLATARALAVERLPESIRGPLAAAEQGSASVAALTEACVALDFKHRGLAADSLYEIGSTEAVLAARSLLSSMPIQRPNAWRYAKSVFKRAMLRHDAVTFGWLAHEIEHTGMSHKPEKASVKSGLDGKQHTVWIFSRKTRQYLQRAAWRYLKDVAKWRPEEYVSTAVEAAIHYGAADLREPRGLIGSIAHCYLLQRILFGRSKRLTFTARSMLFRFKNQQAVNPAPGAREESFPELWDAQPIGYLRLLAAGNLPEVVRFGFAGLERHPEAIRLADASILLRVAAREMPPATALVVAELERRFAAGADLELLDAVMAAGVPALRDRLGGWLEAGDAWLADPPRVLRYLMSSSRAAAARALIRLAPRAAADVRAALAVAILESLRGGEPEPGVHAALAHVGYRALAAELDALVTSDVLLALVDHGSQSARALAGGLLGRREGGLALVGLDRVAAMAESDVAQLRGAAHEIVRGAREELAADPGLLFRLSESEWADTRAVAFEVLRGLGVDKLGLDGIVGLCDSTRLDVRAFGRELAARHLTDLDPDAVLFRLVEHPDRDMKLFALELVRAHLRPGYVPLARIEGFFRACLLDTRPLRELKYGLIDFLAERALADERQGELVAAVLDAFVRSATKEDFERVAAVLARITLAHPEVKSSLRVEATA